MEKEGRERARERERLRLASFVWKGHVGHQRGVGEGGEREGGGGEISGFAGH